MQTWYIHLVCWSGCHLSDGVVSQMIAEICPGFPPPLSGLLITLLERGGSSIKRKKKTEILIRTSLSL